MKKYQKIVVTFSCLTDASKALIFEVGYQHRISVACTGLTEVYNPETDDQDTIFAPTVSYFFSTLVMSVK